MMARRPDWASWQNTTCSCPAWLAALSAERGGLPGVPGSVGHPRIPSWAADRSLREVREHVCHGGYPFQLGS